MFFRKKPIYEYAMLEKIKINLNKYKNKPELLSKICESENYIFYKYKEDDNWWSSSYILRQSKMDKKNIVFFGDYKPLYCVYKEHLFLAEESGEFMKGRDLIVCIDIESGIVTKYKWKSKYGVVQDINGYGRVYSQDTIKKMYVSDEQLIFEIHREKTDMEEAKNYEFNYTMDYILYVKYIDGHFETNYFYMNSNL